KLGSHSECAETFAGFVSLFDWSADHYFFPLSLHDALPIWLATSATRPLARFAPAGGSELKIRFSWATISAKNAPITKLARPEGGDRKSTRLNSSHVKISYAVFCLKKKIMHEDNDFTDINQL